MSIRVKGDRYPSERRQEYERGYTGTRKGSRIREVRNEEKDKTYHDCTHTSQEDEKPSNVDPQELDMGGRKRGKSDRI